MVRGVHQGSQSISRSPSSWPDIWLYCVAQQKVLPTNHIRSHLRDSQAANGIVRIVGGYLRSPQRRILIFSLSLEATYKTSNLYIILLINSGETSATPKLIVCSAAGEGVGHRGPWGKYTIASKNVRKWLTIVEFLRKEVEKGEYKSSLRRKGGSVICQ